jgi:acetolactate synthase-1/2/3 large subunit
MCETFPARWERGAGTPVVERLPYFPETAISAISSYRSVILAGAKPPVSFFGYPGIPSYIISPEQQTVVLAAPEEDVAGALESLADALGAPARINKDGLNTVVQTPPRQAGKLNPGSFSAVIATLLPENAVVMDESNTSMGPFLALSQSAARHTLLTQPGGAIGLGPPCATGAAIARPDRAVINLQADGSAMYTLQALWTQAREGLNVKTIICNNLGYRILGIELMRAGAKEVGEQAQSLMGLTRPAIDWVSLAKGMGVPGVRVETVEDLEREFERAIAEAGPQLIEAIL